MAKDGGPAFPTLTRTGVIEEGDLAGNEFAEHVDAGMTLRDYFAAATLTKVALGLAGMSAENVAAHAYMIADAMLAERAK